MKNQMEPNDNNQFQNTHSFPVSLSENFDGTMEIPYAPDLRPTLPIEPKRRRKAAKRPEQFSKEMLHEEEPEVIEEHGTDYVLAVPQEQTPEFFFDALADSNTNKEIVPKNIAEEQADFLKDVPIQIEADPDLVFPPVNEFMSEDELEEAEPNEAPSLLYTIPESDADEQPTATSNGKSFFFWLPLFVGIILMLGILYLLLPQFKSLFVGQESSGQATSLQISSDMVISSEAATSNSGTPSVISENVESSLATSEFSYSDIQLNRTIFSNDAFSSEAVSQKDPGAFSIYMEQPQISFATNPLAEKRINASLTSIYTDLLEDALHMAEEYADNRAQSEIPQEDLLPGSYHSVCEIAELNEKIVTIMDNADIYNGGASNYQTIHCYHYYVETGERILSDQWVADRESLSALIIDTIQSDETLLSLVHKSVYEKYIEDHICDEWYLSGDGIVFLYQQYNIGPGASGTIEIVLPLDRCQSFLAF